MSSGDQIGFSQRIQLDWLERTANLVLAGSSKDEIRSALREILEDKLSVGAHPERGNREKAITILLRIWVTVPENLAPLRDTGLQLLQTLPIQRHLLIHWGMAAAVYPFFGSVAELTGRLLRLQGTIATSQVQRRVREQFGERETVARAARRILRCFIDWGVLTETAQKGVYAAATRQLVDEPQVASWLVEATMMASGQATALLHGVMQSPMLFPFAVEAGTSTVPHSHERLELLRHGVDDEVVILRARVATEA